MSTSAYAKASAAVNGNDTKTNGMCCANGCTLGGSMTGSTSGSDQWYCRFHFGESASKHDGISTRMANRGDLFKIAEWLTNRQKGATPTSETLDRIRAQRPDLVINPKQTSYSLGQYILQVLGRECRDPQAHMGTPKPVNHGASWLDGDNENEAAA